jgi:hypothetical protein
MADGGRTDYWAPNSDLDPVEPGVWYQSAEGKFFEVCENDFVDLDIENVMPQDPIWGSSFQVLEMKPKSLMVRAYDSITDLYGPIEVSVELVLDIYKRRPHLDAPPEGAVVYGEEE